MQMSAHNNLRPETLRKTTQYWVMDVSNTRRDPAATFRKYFSLQKEHWKEHQETANTNKFQMNWFLSVTTVVK